MASNASDIRNDAAYPSDYFGKIGGSDLCDEYRIRGEIHQVSLLLQNEHPAGCDAARCGLAFRKEHKIARRNRELRVLHVHFRQIEWS